MARGDNRRTNKMRRRKRQTKLKNRIARRAVETREKRAKSK